MSEPSALPGDETDNTTVEATLNITTHSDGEEVERQARNRNLMTTCGLSRQSLAYRVTAAIVVALVVILIEVLQSDDNAAIRDLRDLVFQYALNLTHHGVDS